MTNPHFGDTDDLTLEEQKKAGTPVSGAMDSKHKKFLESLITLIEDGTIDLYDPKTLLNTEVYESLEESWLEKVDIALVNIAQQARLIYEFWKSTETPDESPQLQTMVEQLWLMKEQIEEHHDAFVL